MKTVITGGSSGIGLALAKLLIAKGHTVYSFDVQEPLHKVSGLTHIAADVGDSKAVRAGLEKVGAGIDILIPNAGVIARGGIFDSPENVFDLLFRVNVKGTWLLIKESRPYLANHPMIVVMSSGHVLNPPKSPGVYTWTKQALAALVENMRRDYPEFEVKALYPGPVETPMAFVDADKRTGEEGGDVVHHSAHYLAGKIVELMDDPQKKDLLFDEPTWDYVFR
jgi:NAD(P)-dependent dehydrogenase (short-subunit alcohol dehydrogenase family)